MKKSIVVIFVLIKDTKILVEKRPIKGLLGEHILIPGGTINDLEDLEKALEREMKEELGIIPTEYQLLTDQEILGLHNNLLKPFLIKKWSGQLPEIGLDKEDPYPLSWMEIDEVLTVPIKPTREIAQQIKKYLEK